jgi:hypothetical protein
MDPLIEREEGVMPTPSQDTKQWVDDTDKDIDTLADALIGFENVLGIPGLKDFVHPKQPASAAATTRYPGNMAATRGLAGRKC